MAPLTYVDFIIGGEDTSTLQNEVAAMVGTKIVTTKGDNTLSGPKACDVTHYFSDTTLGRV